MIWQKLQTGQDLSCGDMYLCAKGQMSNGHIIHQNVELSCSFGQAVAYLQFKDPVTLPIWMMLCAARANKANKQHPTNAGSMYSYRARNPVTLCQQLLCVVLCHSCLDNFVSNGGQHSLIPVEAKVLHNIDRILKASQTEATELMHRPSSLAL